MTEIEYYSQDVVDALKTIRNELRKRTKEIFSECWMTLRDHKKLFITFARNNNVSEAHQIAIDELYEWMEENVLDDMCSFLTTLISKTEKCLRSTEKVDYAHFHLHMIKLHASTALCNIQRRIGAIAGMLEEDLEQWNEEIK